jgi:hypothetical protein
VKQENLWHFCCSLAKCTLSASTGKEQIGTMMKIMIYFALKKIENNLFSQGEIQLQIFDLIENF